MTDRQIGWELKLDGWAYILKVCSQRRCPHGLTLLSPHPLFPLPPLVAIIQISYRTITHRDKEYRYTHLKNQAKNESEIYQSKTVYMLQYIIWLLQGNCLQNLSSFRSEVNCTMNLINYYEVTINVFINTVSLDVLKWLNQFKSNNNMHIKLSSVISTNLY